MKRYVKASFDASMPEWLRTKLLSKYGSFKSRLMKKYGVALDRANFMDRGRPGDIPIYLIESDYGNEVYSPGVNDDETITINGRNRKLGSIAKSKLPEMAIDMVFVDVSDSDNLIPKKDRYKDPRYSYRKSDKGQYAGQYKRRPYLGNQQYGEEEWSTKGITPSNERRARDKSGYIVPSPEEMIANYYSKFPDKITSKLDSLYVRLEEVKGELMSAPFNTPSDFNERYSIDNMYTDFGRAVSEYRNLLKQANGKDVKGGYLEFFLPQLSRSSRYIKDTLDEIEDNL